MASSAILVAKRAFVSVLLALGCAYRLAFTINRDSDDADILRAYRRPLTAVHQPRHAHTQSAWGPHVGIPLRREESSLKEGLRRTPQTPLPP